MCFKSGVPHIFPRESTFGTGRAPVSRVIIDHHAFCPALSPGLRPAPRDGDSGTGAGSPHDYSHSCLHVAGTDDALPYPAGRAAVPGVPDYASGLPA